jgi:prevent-host-death family protein
MVRQITATEAKAHFLSLLDDVEGGEEIEITRHGHTIARITPARGPQALKDKHKDVVTMVTSDEDLINTGLEWDLDDDSA